MSQAFKHDVNQWHHQPSYVPLRSFALQSTGRLNLFQGYFKNFADSWFLIYTILVEFVVLVVMVTMLMCSTIWIYPCDENPHSLIRIRIVDRSYTYLLISWSSLVIWPPSIVGWTPGVASRLAAIAFWKSSSAVRSTTGLGVPSANKGNIIMLFLLYCATFHRDQFPPTQSIASASNLSWGIVFLQQETDNSEFYLEAISLSGAYAIEQHSRL